MHGNPANYPIYHNLFRGKIDTATVREISLDAKGRLFKVIFMSCAMRCHGMMSCHVTSSCVMCHVS